MKNIKFRFPFFVKWNISPNCNLRCKHCFIKNYNNSFPDINKIKQILDGLAQKKISTLFLTGGEPFLRDDLEEIVKYINKRFNVLIATNGTMLKDERIKKINFYGVNKYQVSLDGFNSATNDFIRGNGSFDKTINGIKLLKSNDCKIVISYTLNSYNYKYINKIVKLSEDLNVDILRFELFIPLGSGENSNLGLNKFQLKYIKETLFSLKSDHVKIVLPIFNSPYGCGAAYFSCTINSDFSISPCDLLIEDYKSKPINNINDFQNIWLDSDIFEKWRSFKVDDEFCNKCHRNNKCNFGCRASAIACSNNINAPDKLCIYRDIQ